MKIIKSIALGMTGLLMAATLAFAHEYEIGKLTIVHPNAKATIAGASVAGGFMKIANDGDTDDTLLSVTTDAAKDVQIHQMSMEGDVMKMGRLADGLPIPAGQMTILKPGGVHIMFMGIAKPFKEGDLIKATLTFEKAGTINIEFMVGPANGEMNHEKHKHDSGSAN